jgi:hypothetical protein
MVMHALVFTLLFVPAVDDAGIPSDDAPLAAPDDATPPVVDDAPSVTDDTAPVVEEAPPVVEEAPPVAEEAPPVVEEAPVLDESAREVNDRALDDESPAPLPVRMDPCRPLVEAGDRAAAIRCLKERPAKDDADARRLAEQILVLESLESGTPKVPRLTLQSFLLSGRPEFVLGSAMSGAVLAPLVIAHGAFLANSAVGGRWPIQQWQVPTPIISLASSGLILSPLVGGTLGLVGGALLVLTPRLLTDGDSDFLRSALLMSAFNLALSWTYGTYFPRPPWERYLGFVHAPTLYTGIALASFITPVVGAGALAAVVDMPAGGGAAGLTAGALAAVLSLLVLGAVDVVVDPWVPIALVGASAHVAYVSTVGVSFLYPFHRMKTWLVDIGALAGFLASTALVLGIPAGNPVAGYGGMAVGMMSGALGGVLVSELVPFVVDALPSLDEAVSVPLMLPSLDGRSVGVGMAIASPFDSSPLAWR